MKVWMIWYNPVDYPMIGALWTVAASEEIASREAEKILREAYGVKVWVNEEEVMQD